MVSVNARKDTCTARWPSSVFLLWSAGVRNDPSTSQNCKNFTEWLLWNEVRKDVIMAKGNTKKPKSKNSVFHGFVSVGLNVERKAAVKSWGSNWEGVIGLLAELILDDYRVSFSAANEGSAVQCSVTCRDDKDINFGWCMTSRAPTWQDALRVAMWKHFELCERDWSEFLEGDVDDAWG